MAADYYSDAYNNYGMPDMSNGGPSGVPDPNNPGYDTAGYPLGAGAVAAPITGGSWGAGTPQANGVTPTFTPTTPTGPVTNAGGQVWGGGGPNGNFDTNGNPMSFSGAGDTPPPPPPPPPGGGILAPFSEASPAIPNAPAFVAPRDAPAPFAFDKFSQPTIEEAQNDPGQQFRMQQGTSALQNWAAAKGTLNDSDTAKALINYGQNAGAQGYADVWNRDFNTYNVNRNNAADVYDKNVNTQYLMPNSQALLSYNTNYGTQYKDPYLAAYQAWAQRGSNYLQNQGIAANTALGYAQL